MNFEQGELEHRSPKAWYTCTDRKDYIKQITQIEHCEFRLRRIKQKNSQVVPSKDDVARTPEQHYHIGKTQNTPQNIGGFLRDYRGDPAIKVCRL